MSATQFSALRLANALAVRLDGAVPSPIRVSAERPAPPLSEDDIVLRFANGAEHWGGVVIGAAGLKTRTDEFAFDVAADIAVQVLNCVQDSVVRILGDRWPRMPTGEIALPDARVDAYCIYLWFGPGENRAALTLPPVELPELVN